MYEYSPISKIRIKNFRNLGDVELSFEQSPIISLVGKNEAGKTSVVKAFAACALHISPREQKDWIRDGTKMFGVEISLADGTTVVRVKEADGINMYRVVYPDGKVWDTNKITDGLPEEVSKAMGLMVEPETGELLHVRTYEDKLLFVVTPNSTNYKVMYNALKVEQLTKAIKLGSTEANDLKAEMNKNELSIQTLNSQLRTLNIVDVEPIVSIRDRLELQLASLDKMERANGLVSSLKEYERQLGALALLDMYDLQPINEMLASDISSINRLLNNRSELVNYSTVLKELDNTSEIDLGVLNRLLDIVSKKELLESKIADAGSLNQLNEIDEISEVVAMHLNKANTLLNSLETLNNDSKVLDISECHEITQSSLDSLNSLALIQQKYSEIDTKKEELSKAEEYIEQVQNYLKQCGVAVEACPKCGEAVVFDIEKLS